MLEGIAVIIFTRVPKLQSLAPTHLLLRLAVQCHFDSPLQQLQSCEKTIESVPQNRSSPYFGDIALDTEYFERHVGTAVGEGALCAALPIIMDDGLIIEEL